MRGAMQRMVLVAGLGLVALVRPTEAASEPGSAFGPNAPDCEGQPLRKTGSVYFYCDCAPGAVPGCVPGDDSRPGTSMSAPRRSLANARERFNKMSAGDTVALCRGGAWEYGGDQIHNGRCTAQAPCDFRDYVPQWGSAASPRPKLDVGANNAFSLTAPMPSQGYRFWNLDIKQSSKAGRGFFFYGDVNDVDVCNVQLSGASLGIELAMTGAGVGFTIRRSQFSDHGFSALLAGADGLIIDSNRFHNNGLHGTPQDHSIYLFKGKGVRLTGNEFVTDERCGGVMLVIHGELTDLLVENNLFSSTSTNPNCYATQSAGSNAYGEFHDVRWLRNRITSAGPTAIEASACSDCTIADNVIVGGGVSVGVREGGNTGPTTRVKVQNNSLYRSSVSISRFGEGHVVENNAVWTDGATCYDVKAPTVRNANNYCRSRGGPPVQAVWVDAPRGDFRPANPGPLVGTGSGEHYSPVAMGSVAWSPVDPGNPRAPPIDLGAFRR